MILKPSVNVGEPRTIRFVDANPGDLLVSADYLRKLRIGYVIGHTYSAQNRFETIRSSQVRIDSYDTLVERVMPDDPGFSGLVSSAKEWTIDNDANLARIGSIKLDRAYMFFKLFDGDVRTEYDREQKRLAQFLVPGFMQLNDEETRYIKQELNRQTREIARKLKTNPKTTTLTEYAP